MRYLFQVLTLFISIPFVSAQLSVPSVFSDRMVLQRETDIPVWGDSPAGTKIMIEIGNNQARTTAGENGEWMVRLPRMEAGGPYLMKISDLNHPGETIEFSDVLIGDVWFASGQSNMEWQVQQSMDAEKEIGNADYPGIRFFQVPHAKSLQPEDDLKSGSWEVCDKNRIKTASAVAYFFARKIHTDEGIPVGILQSTWGGTPVEAWTSREMLLSSDITAQRVRNDDSLTLADFIQDSLDLIGFWDIVYNIKNETDKIVPVPSYDDSGWPKMEMPKTFKDWGMPFYEGIIWMRKKIRIGGTMTGKDLIINLGLPEMNYTLYFNGYEICRTIWNANPEHSYTIPAEYIREGENIISVRMSFLWGGGGFNPPEEKMYLTDGTEKISLAGTWKYRKDLELPIPKIYNYHYYPSFLFNAMINPVIPYGLRGFIWYQGEANDTAALHYRSLFPMLISDWRIRWQQGYLPFLYVQLPNYKAVQPEPSESDWAELREAQAMTLKQPATGMVCTIDLGNANTIHPLNKQDVGYRLALVAEKEAYGCDCVASGPMYMNSVIEGNQITIRFSGIGSGLIVKGDNILKGFSIAGKDRKFYWARARIEGDEVIVTSDRVTKPVAARYAWADNPACNLYNREGFPAVPFRTDTW
jgi:sialate O-acetylesterase